MAKRERAAHRVDEVVSASLELFHERGYDNTPLSAVAERLGITKAGLYHHFRSKEDLLFVAHKRAMERQLVPLLDAADAEPDPDRRLRDFIYNQALTLAREPSASLLIREARRLAPEHIAVIRQTWRRGLRMLRTAIAELQAAGRCRADLNPTYAAFAVIGMTNWISFWFDARRPGAAEEVARTMVELFMGGLLSEGAAAGVVGRSRTGKLRV